MNERGEKNPHSKPKSQRDIGEKRGRIMGLLPKSSPSSYPKKNTTKSSTKLVGPLRFSTSYLLLSKQLVNQLPSSKR
jgi:hypothetical protein